MKEKEFIYVRESFLASILSDMFTFGFLFGGLLLNKFVLYGRWYIDIFFIVAILLVGTARSRTKIFSNKKALEDYLKEEHVSG